MTRAEDFVERYVDAWLTEDDDVVRDAFAPDAIYRGYPSDDEPAIGIDAIVAMWHEQADPPGSWTFDWHIVAEEGDVAVIQGVTTYADGATFDTLWVVRLDAAGRACDFTEWYVRRD